MFAYCHNNPVNMSDESGYLPKWLKKAAKAVKNTVTKYLGKDKHYKAYLGKYQGTQLDCTRFGYKTAARVGVSTEKIAKGVKTIEILAVGVSVVDDLQTDNPVWNMAITLGNFASDILAGKIIGAAVVGGVTFIGLPAIVGTVVTIGASAIAGYYIGKAFDN